VIRANLAARSRQVKELIEAAWEATTGSTYTKPTTPASTLALYVLDGSVHFFLDVPGGLSKHYPPDEDATLARVREAAQKGRPLPLSPEVTRDLGRIRSAADRVVFVAGSLEGLALRQAGAIHVHWEDPYHGLGRGREGLTATLVRTFPFLLPESVVKVV
jgi:hypothetical protein